MAYSRRLGVIGILGAAWLTAVGCGDDSGKTTKQVAEGGEAGESNGGAPGSGGSNSNAGKAGGGMAGTGMAGTGGTAAAGMGGGGGEPNAAGAGEIGAAGSEAAGASNGGAAGEGGAGGAPSTPKALACDYECQVDDDCVRPGAVDVSNKCNMVTKRCEDPTAVCSVNSDCMAYVSDWVTPCADSTACFEGFEACVTVKGKGVCASLVDVDFGCLSGAPVTMPRFGAQGEVQVCGSEDPRCFDGKCAAGCGDSFKGGCNNGEGNVCNTNTGLCECDTSDDCASNLCENRHCLDCATSADCLKTSQSTGLDTCVNGKCGCSGSQACISGGFKNAPPVCE